MLILEVWWVWVSVGDLVYSCLSLLICFFFKFACGSYWFARAPAGVLLAISASSDNNFRIVSAMST